MDFGDWFSGYGSGNGSFLPFILGMGASMLFGNQQRPQMPQNITIESAKLPDPVQPPNLPLNPSLTAASQRARASQISNRNDIVLTSPRSRENDGSAIARTTLLGA